MRHFWVAVGLLGLSACAQSLSDKPPEAEEGPHQVRLALTGLQCCDIPVLVGLYRNPSDWLKQNRVFKARLVLPQSEEATLTLYGLPAGRYAIAAYQDSNGNGRLDRWFWLLPREPVAFSEVAQWRAPPNYDQASFDVPGRAAVQVSF